jgi:hypothetical protein
MPRSPRTDPAILERLRQARAAEDAALAVISSAQAHLDAAAAKRSTVLADLDAAVENAQTELAQARGGLVAAAGVERAALALGMSRAALRRALPQDKQPDRRPAADRTHTSSLAAPSAGGVR